MKVNERIALSLIRQVVTINWSTLGGLYADALVIIADSMGECVRILLTWKLEGGYGEVGTESECGEDQIMICSTGLDLLQSSGEFPCAICRSGVGSNSIMYKRHMHWVYNKCKGLKHL